MRALPSRLVSNATGARLSALGLALLLAVLLATTSPASAAAAPERFSVRGAGYGHGVGLSQFGAYGYALHGVGYKDILHHYYAQTRITSVGASVVRVLLQANESTIRFSGATSAGAEKLKEGSIYSATRRGSNVVLKGPSGRRLGTYSGRAAGLRRRKRAPPRRRHQRCAQRPLPRLARDSGRGRSRLERNRHRRNGELPPGRGSCRKPSDLAAGGAAGAGGRRPLVRARHPGRGDGSSTSTRTRAARCTRASRRRRQPRRPRSPLPAARS